MLCFMINYSVLFKKFQVGGPLSVAVRSHMNDFGRISVCGAISLYNDTTPTLVPCVEPAMVFKQLKMEGFLIHRWTNRFQEGMSQMLTWIQEVSLSFKSFLFSFLDFSFF